MKINEKKVTISAKCLPSSKEIIKTSEYTYGDGVDLFARIIQNKEAKNETFLTLADSELFELNLQLEKIKMEIFAIEVFKNKILSNLKSKNENYRSNYKSNFIKEDNIRESVNTILKIANRFQCDPLEVDKFTGTKTINFHANKCDISVYDLKKHLKPD